jgi:hypothetical protein
VGPYQFLLEKITFSYVHAQLIHRWNSLLDGLTCSLDFNRFFPLSQNVIGVVNFDFTFQFVLTGWEGAALDGKFLRNALTKGFKIKPGK